jgi:hypothetical protein
MKHGDRIATYIIEFNQLALLTQWGNSALWHQFYEGLPRQIKDDMVYHTYVNTLTGVKSVAQLINAQYWKREGKKECERDRERGSGASGTSGNMAGNIGRTGNPSGGQKGGRKKGASNKNPSPAPASGSKGTSKQAGNSGAGATGKAADASKPKRKPYADKLDSHGKLKPEERERWRKLGLCMFCGGSGHTVEDCKKCLQEAQVKATSTESSTSQSGQASTSQGDKSSESKK